MNNLILTAINASIQAGKEILSVYESDNFEVEVKPDDSPLTRADKNAHNKILEFLESTGIPILSEEGKHLPFEERKKWKKFWMVDPLDGTKEFIKRNGEFTVNIALIEKNKPVAGIIFVPVTGELYFGSLEIGSFKVTLPNNNFKEVKPVDFESFVCDQNKLPFKNNNEKYTVVGSRSHLSAETKEYFDKLEKQHKNIDVIIKGSSLKICMVAENKADEYPRFGPTMEWDTAAGHAIVVSAGCKFTKPDGSQFHYNKKELLNSYFIVKKS